MKTLVYLAILLLPIEGLGRTVIVDVNGSGDFTVIQPAINAAFSGDTVKVLPGFYDGQINVGKSVVLIGSGYETTIIVSNNDPTVNMSAGKILWFAITSNLGVGIVLGGGQVTNCVIRGCIKDGITIPANSTGIISNCIIIGNGGIGISTGNQNNASIYNSISVNNASYGFYAALETGLNVSYSCGSMIRVAGAGNVDADPGFMSDTDYHIYPTSPAFNTGKQDLADRDGSRSDMGYFGGPDEPIYPVVIEVDVNLIESGLQIRAKGRANY
jgi:hypothetical protein